PYRSGPRTCVSCWSETAGWSRAERCTRRIEPPPGHPCPGAVFSGSAGSEPDPQLAWRVERELNRYDDVARRRSDREVCRGIVHETGRDGCLDRRLQDERERHGAGGLIRADRDGFIVALDADGDGRVADPDVFRAPARPGSRRMESESQA